MKNKYAKSFYSILYPTLFVAILWVIKGYEEYNDVSFAQYGIYPRKLDNLLGIIATPFLHGSIDHLLANTLPLLILGTIILYVYDQIAIQIFIWIYITTGLWVWAASSSDAYHIGASGIIYGMEGFLIFSGIFRRNPKLLALSLLVVFLYGSTIWGIFPLKIGVSWESHLYGGIAGLIIAYAFKNDGPANPTYDLETDVEAEQIALNNEVIDNGPKKIIPAESTPNFTIKIHYVPTPKETDELDNKKFGENS